MMMLWEMMTVRKIEKRELLGEEMVSLFSRFDGRWLYGQTVR